MEIVAFKVDILNLDIVIKAEMNLKLVFMQSVAECSIFDNRRKRSVSKRRNLIHQWKQNDVDMALLDSAKIAGLEGYAEMRYPVGARAMGLLFLNNALDYQEPLILPGEGGDKSNSGRKKRSSLQSDNVMVLFPNPSSNYFTLDYSLRDLFNSGTLVIIDASGKTIYQTEINYTRDQLLIATDNWPGGQYSCILLIDGKTTLSEKITIIK